MKFPKISLLCDENFGLNSDNRQKMAFIAAPESLDEIARQIRSGFFGQWNWSAAFPDQHGRRRKPHLLFADDENVRVGNNRATMCSSGCRGNTILPTSDYCERLALENR